MSGTPEIVVISDIHFHDWRTAASGSGANNSRLKQTCRVVRESLEYAGDGRPWICAGDFFETIGHTENAVMNRVLELFDEYSGVRKIGIWGDHDTRGKGSHRVSAAEAATTPLARQDVGLQILDDETTRAWLPGAEKGSSSLHVYGAGAQPRAEMVNLGPGADVGLFHMTVSGAETPSGYQLPSGVTGLELADLYRLTIAGDVHHPQTYWSNDGRLLLVPGAPEQHNFGDKGDRGWWTVQMEQREDGWWPVEAEMHPSDSPKFIQVETRAEVDEGDDNFYRITGEEVDPDDLPEGVEVVSSPPTTIETRDTLKDAHTIDEILQTWLEEQEVPEDEWDEYLDRAHDLLQEEEILQLRDCRLQRVEMENFLSFKGEHVHDIQDGVTLVLGESGDFDSNGAGKSALIVESIYWTLFNRTARDLSADAVIFGHNEDPPRDDAAGRAQVRLEFEMADGTPLWIERTRKPGRIEVEAEIDGDPVGGSSATAIAARFTDALGLTSEIYRALACYNQEELLLLSRSTDSERKELIADLSGLGVYQTASSNASSMEGEVDSEMSELYAKLETLKEQRDESEDELDEVREDKERWETEHRHEMANAAQELDYAQDMGDRKVKEAWDRVGGIRQRAEALKDRRVETIYANEEVRTMHLADERVGDLRDRIGEVEAQRKLDLGRDQLETALDTWRDRRREFETELADVDDHLKDLRRKHSGAETRYREAKAKLEEVEALEPGDECPECGQEIAESHVQDLLKKASGRAEETRVDYEEADALLASVRNEREGIEEDLQQAESKIDLLERELERIEKVEDLDEQIDVASQQAAQRARDQMEHEASEVRRHYEDWIDRAVAAAEDIEDEWARRQARAQEEVDRLRQAENPHAGTVQRLEDRLEKLRQRIRAGDDRLDDLKADRRVYRFWAEGFSKRGIQSLLLDEIADAFNRKRKEIFPLLTHGVYDVQFSTTSKTQKGETREKTEFHVTQHGRPVEYGSLSGGQKRRVDVGVMLTLILANAHRQQVPGVLGLVVLDEVFDFLDSDGAETLSATLDQMTDTIPSIYVVTQNSDMQSMFPQTLLVEQGGDGASRIVS